MLSRNTVTNGDSQSILKKTKIVVFSGGQQKKYKFMFDDLEIEVTKEFKYLGIYFTRGSSFDKAKKHIVEQANKAMYSLLKKIRTLNLPLDMQLELFDKTIKPILLYGAEVWGFGNCDIIERVHLKFLKYVLNLKKSTPSRMIYGELGIFPIKIEIQHRTLSYWCKLISDSCETLGTQKLSTYVYSLIFNMHENKKLKSEWLQNIKTNLNHLGYSGIWNIQTAHNIKSLTASLKRKLQDQYIQDWSNKSNTSSSNMHYRLVKTTFERSHYFNLLPDNPIKKMVAFRTRNHRLPVEVGSWAGSKVNERTCQYCNGELGDEFHYVLNCKLFTNDRKKYINRYYYRRPNVMKYNELMNTTNATNLKNLTYFVSKIMKTVQNAT